MSIPFPLCCTTALRRSQRRSQRRSSACPAGTSGSRWPTATAAPTAGSTGRWRIPGSTRLQGQHCYELIARDEVREALEEEPGTYFLTDFLARTFEHTVMKELGLDRHPELRDAYFGNYTRVIWLAQRPTLGDEAGGRARGGRPRSPARGARGRRRRPGARAGSAAHVGGRPSAPLARANGGTEGGEVRGVTRLCRYATQTTSNPHPISGSRRSARGSTGSSRGGNCTSSAWTTARSCGG